MSRKRCPGGWRVEGKCVNIEHPELYRVISNGTGFDQGEKFTNAKEVRAYFKPKSQIKMFGDDAISDPRILEHYADMVIEHRWHME